MKSIELFWISGSPPCWRVMLALEVKRINYISRQLDASAKEHQSPEFLRLNPRGKVPVLKADDIVVYESLAIISYLDLYQSEPALLGNDPRLTAAIWQWLMDFENHLQAAFAVVAKASFRQQMEGRRDEILIAKQIIRAEIQSINEHLSDQPYLRGDSLSTADITLYPSLQWLRRALSKSATDADVMELTDFIADCAGLVRWEDMIEALPGYDRTYPPHWRRG